MTFTDEQFMGYNRLLSDADFLGAGKKTTDEYGADITPLPFPELPPMDEAALEVHPGTDPLVRKAALAGVSYDSPAPAGRALASLGYDEKFSLNGFKIGLKEFYGREIPIRIGSDTGEVEYLSPKTNRWSLVDAPGIDSGDLEDLAGDAIVAGPELAAGFGAAVATKNPLWTKLAAGAGAFTGEIARLDIGRRLGVNEGLTDEAIILQAAKVGGISVAAGEAGDRFLQFGRWFLSALRGKGIPKAIADRLGFSADEALGVANEINAKLESTSLRFNLAQATRDDDLLNIQESFRRSREFGPRFAEFSDAQTNALNEFYKIINRPFQSRLTREEVASGMQDIAGTRARQEIILAQQPVTAAERELDERIVSLRDTPYQSVGKPVREAFGKEYETFRAEASRGADLLEQAFGEKPFIRGTNLSDTLKSLDRKMRGLIVEGLKGPEARLLGKATEPNITVKYKFKDVWNTISVLKEKARAAEKGLSTETASAGTYRRLATALEEDLRIAANESPAKSAYDDYIQWYAKQKDRLDRSIVGQTMEKSGNKFVVHDENVFGKLFPKGGTTEAREVFDVVKNHTEAFDAIGKGLLNLYKETVGVAADGRVKARLHQQFLKDYDGALKLFFSREEYRNLRSIDGLEKALQAREANRDRIVKAISRTYKAEIAGKDTADEVFRMIWNPNKPEGIDRAFLLLDHAPHLKRGVLNEIRKDMRDKITTLQSTKSGPDRFLSAQKLEMYLNGRGGEKGHRDILVRAFGQPYVQDMDLLLKALKFAQAEARNPNVSNTAFWSNPTGRVVKDLARAYVGLFTRPGRIITAVARIRGRQAGKALGRIVLDPDMVHALATMTETPTSARKGAALLSQLGATEFIAGD